MSSIYNSWTGKIMNTLHLTNTDTDLKMAAKLLLDGQIIAFPTETVFGLGISLDLSSYEKLYTLKERPKQKALTVHISDIKYVFQFVEKVDDRFFLLADEYLPGPLTLIMRAKKDLHLPFVSDQTIGIRLPSDLTAQKFIEDCGGAIFATSANLSGESPCLCSNEVKEVFGGKIAAIIKEGNTECLCKASTVVSLVNDMKILREGSITQKEIAKVLQKQKMSV